MSLIFTLLGYFGSIILASQYLMMVSKYINQDSFQFYFLNTLASILIMLSLYIHTNYPSIWIEVFWLAVSFYGCIKNRNRFEYWGKE